MARRTWKDRAVEKPRTFNLQNNVDGTITLIPAPGVIVEPGTPVNAANLNGLEDDVYAHMADYTLQVPYSGATTNTGNAYSIATPVITALAAGMAISIKINADSTGASTLDWNGKGAKPIKKANGNDVTNLKANGIYTLRYDGTNFILQGEGASGDALASDLLLGKKATTDAGEITGTLNLSNLISSNIIKGVTINGVVGAALRVASGQQVGNNTATFTITGLTFQPSKISIWPNRSGGNWNVGDAHYWGGTSTACWSNSVTITPNASGFTAVISGGTWSSAYTYNWIAIE